MVEISERIQIAAITVLGIIAVALVAKGETQTAGLIGTGLVGFLGGNYITTK